MPPLAADELAPSEVEVLEQVSSDYDDSDTNDDGNVRVVAIEGTFPLRRLKGSALAEAVSIELSPSDLIPPSGLGTHSLALVDVPRHEDPLALWNLDNVLNCALAVQCDVSIFPMTPHSEKSGDGSTKSSTQDEMYQRIKEY